MTDGQNHLKYQGETRYWEKLGMRVTYDLAVQFASRMDGAGAYFDDEAEEFTEFAGDSEGALKEVERLFAAPDIDPDATVGKDNDIILRTIEWQRKNRKRLLSEFRDEFDRDNSVDDFKRIVLEEDPDIDEALAENIANTQYDRERTAYAEQKFDEILEETVVGWKREAGLLPDEEE